MSIAQRLAKVIKNFAEIIENVPKEYYELMEEAIQSGKNIPCRRVFTEDHELGGDPLLCCPVCGFFYMHMPAVALVTYSTCIITTKRGTKIIRSEGLGERMGGRGWRLVMFCECENGHTTKIMFQFSKGNIHLLYDKIGRQKFKTITKSEIYDDISRW
jgi:hypothetical protein